jgi:hypothetical protein
MLKSPIYHGAFLYGFLCHWKVLNEYMCMKVVSYCLDLWCKSYQIILNKIFKENSSKSKIKLKKLGNFFGIVENPFMNGFLGGDFIIFRPKVGEILDFD